MKEKSKTVSGQCKPGRFETCIIEHGHALLSTGCDFLPLQKGIGRKAA